MPDRIFIVGLFNGKVLLEISVQHFILKDLCMEDKISELASALIKKYRQHRLISAFTVTISGIDAACKGYISKLLKEVIEANG